MELKELKSSEISEIRKIILEEQNFKCAICGKDISNSNFKSKQNHLHTCSNSSLNL